MADDLSDYHINLCLIGQGDKDGRAFPKLSMQGRRRADIESNTENRNQQEL